MHDADFDKKSDRSEFNLKLGPKQIFWGGFVVGALALATLGFILSLMGGSSLGSMFKGSLDRNNPAPSAPAAPTAAAPTNAGTPPSGPVPPLTKADHVRGDLAAPVTLVEYSDFQCPFCERFHPTLQQVMNDYKGKVKWVYRSFPLTSIHPDAEKAAEAAECANDQGKFWEMADKMFAMQQTSGVGIAQLPGYAQAAGVKDIAAFNNCLSSGKYAKAVADSEAGGESAGVTGTPGTFVIDKNGKTQLIPGALPIDAVKTMIDTALKG